MNLRIVAVICMAAYVFSSCGMLPEEEGTLVPPIITPAEIPFRTILLEEQDIEDTVLVRGAVAPSVMENYFFQEKGGRIKSFNVKVGDFVQAGDVLIELIVDQLPDNIAYQKLTVLNLQEDYDRTLGIQKLERARESASLEKQRKTIEDMEAYASIYTAREISDAKEALSQAEINYDILTLTQEKSVSQKANTLNTEKLRLAKYEETMEASYIRSKIPGIVTYLKRGFIGDVVTDFETLISVADITEMQVDYQGSQAYRFELGMPVELVYRGKSYSGTVTLTPDSVPAEERPNYMNSAVFAIDSVPDNYQMGDDVDIRATLDSRQGVIVLPKDAIKTFGSDKIVYVLEDGEKKERYISLGIESGPYVEILEGLEAGDEVITN